MRNATLNIFQIYKFKPKTYSLHWCTGFFWSSLMLSPQTSSQFIWKPFIALFADWFQIAFVEFCFLVHFLITNGTGEMMNTPSFIQGGENWANRKCKKCVWFCNNFTYHHLQSLGCTNNRGFQKADGSEFRNKLNLSSRNGDVQRRVFRILHKRSAETQR